MFAFLRNVTSYKIIVDHIQSVVSVNLIRDLIIYQTSRRKGHFIKKKNGNIYSHEKRENCNDRRIVGEITDNVWYRIVSKMSQKRVKYRRQ